MSLSTIVVSHSKPFLITPERGRKERAGAENGKRGHSKTECAVFKNEKGDRPTCNAKLTSTILC